LKFQEENQTPYLPTCETSHEKLKTPKMIRRKYKNKNLSKFTRKKADTPLSPL
jgi:hypothetical protein